MTLSLSAPSRRTVAVATLGLAAAFGALAQNPAPSPSLKVVQAFYEAYGKGDLAGIRAVLAPEVRWTIPGHHPLSGTKVDADEIVAYFRQLQKAGFKAELLYLSGNDRYVVDVHRGWGSFGDNKVDMNWVLFYEVRDGKIVNVQNFAGNQHEVDLFFSRTWQLKPIPERVAP